MNRYKYTKDQSRKICGMLDFLIEKTKNGYINWDTTGFGAYRCEYYGSIITITRYNYREPYVFSIYHTSVNVQLSLVGRLSLGSISRKTRKLFSIVEKRNRKDMKIEHDDIIDKVYSNMLIEKLAVIK